MDIILYHDHIDAALLADVTRAMTSLGAPTIKAVWVECYDAWVALEGCHRLRAAPVLGLCPEIEEIAYDEETLLSDLGIHDQTADDGVTIDDVLGGAPIRTMLSW